MPYEVQSKQEYDEQTEIYFVGVLFKHILKDDSADFRFQHILKKMTKVNPSQRYTSFHEIASDVSVGVLGEINFTDDQKIHIAVLQMHCLAISLVLSQNILPLLIFQLYYQNYQN